jgi:hypothetical protein
MSEAKVEKDDSELTPLLCFTYWRALAASVLISGGINIAYNNWPAVAGNAMCLWLLWVHKKDYR